MSFLMPHPPSPTVIPPPPMAPMVANAAAETGSAAARAAAAAANGAVNGYGGTVQTGSQGTAAPSSAMNNLLGQ